MIGIHHSGGDGAALTGALAVTGVRGRLRRIGAVVLRDYYVLRRSLPRLLEIVYWPLVEVLIWGYVSLFLQANRLPTIMAVLLGGILLWQVLYRSQETVTVAFLEDIWSRNLLNVFTAPLAATEYLAGVIVFGLLKLIAGTAVMAALAFLLYGFGLLRVGPELVPFVFLLLVMGWSLATLTIGIILRFGQSAEIVAWAMAFAFQPFSAVFYPVDVLPAGMQAVAHLVPASYIFEGMRAALAGEGVVWGNLGAAAGLDVLYAAGAVWFMARMLAHVRRNGGLSRFGE
ncbi:MAG TPA: ABC transporter permease [Actinomycetes bacterium]|jgi:ABC-2 type transport system permease protein|nr:ABC transporter permease [Actinomycetes bacterium]